MAVIRKRLIIWLIKAYIKKSGKTIFFSFICGLVIFFLFVLVAKYYSYIIPFTRIETIGEVGAYTEDQLPDEITGNIAEGLTIIAPNGTIKPGLAASWKVLDNGKTYIFHLKQGLFFYDGQEVTSNTVNYNFTDVTEMKPDKFTIVFKLNDSYSPFLVTVSKPIYDKGFSGVGNYHLENIKTSYGFVQSLTLVQSKGGQNIINYIFYPTEDALKTAYLLGEVTSIEGVSESTAESVNWQKYRNTTVNKIPDYSQLVTLFFNNDDNNLSNKNVRLALAYAIPTTFNEGQSAYSLYSPYSVYYNNNLDDRAEDIAEAKSLLEPSATSSLSGHFKPPTNLTIITSKKYYRVAQTIAASWKNLGITTSIQEQEGIPNAFQIFLGDFNIPKDPDQYTLWHSDAPDNITHYKNLRIDQLLEDGRKTVDVGQRKIIYADFQKYLMEDAPAVFLYYPDEYTISRN